MTRNSPELEQLLRAEHSAVAPPEGTLEHGLGRFGQTLSAGLPLGLQVPIPPAASTATVGAGVAVKVGLVAAVTVSLGVGLFVAQPRSTSEATPTLSLSVAQRQPPPKQAPPAEVAVAEEPSRESVSRPSAAPVLARSVKPAAADAFSLELELVQQARAQLSAGQPARALQTLGQHQARFPRGQLTQDRLALRALSLCQAGRLEEGRREADRLIQREPQSVYVDRLRSSCR